MQFKAFKPEAMNKIAKTMGYQGDMGQFQNFIEQDRERQKQMDMYTNAAKMMAKGGVVKMQTGGAVQTQPVPSSGNMVGGIPGQGPAYGPQTPKTTGQITQTGPQVSFGPLPTQTPAQQAAAQANFSQQQALYPSQGTTTRGGGVLQAQQTPTQTPTPQQPQQPQQQQQQQQQQPQLTYQQQRQQQNAARIAKYNVGTQTLPQPVASGIDPNQFPNLQDAQKALEQQFENQRKQAGYNLPANYMANEYKTNDGTQFVPPFAPDEQSITKRLVTLFPSEQDYITEVSKLFDQNASEQLQRNKLLEDAGYTLQTDANGYSSYKNPNSNISFGAQPPPTVQDKQAYIARMLEDRDNTLNNPSSGQGIFGNTGPMTPAMIAQEIAQAKQNAAAAQQRVQSQGGVGIDPSFYDAPEFKYYLQNHTSSMVSGMAVYNNPYLGQVSGPNSNNDKMVSAYIAYLKRTGQTNKIAAPQNNQQVLGLPSQLTPPTTNAPLGGSAHIGDTSVQRMYQPGLPVGGTTVAAGTPTDPSQMVSGSTGQLTGQVGVSSAQATTAQTPPIAASQANTMQAVQAAPAVSSALQATQAAQANPNDPGAQIAAAQQTASSVGNVQAAQGQAQLINNPVQRQIQAGEIITGTGVDAAAAASVTAQTQAAAAAANPTLQATVQGQLDGLMQQFVGGNTPAWAAGAIRSANSAMAARGLGASSLAGQAIVQAAMESALPIAQADAQTIARFESQNLSNRQQAAMLAAEQRAKFIGQEFDQAFQMRVQNAARVADVANQNFTAEQQVQLENSRIANTMNLQNLSNSQAIQMAEAAALAQLDVANLSNRQAAAVRNAEHFLQTNLANLSNQQQTELFKSQQRVQSLFTDQAAQNAARQFNASSQNQVDQFFANLGQQASQFNATQQNAQAQFNAGQENTINRFNAELNNQRDQFNAQNQIVIAQSNAQWRRQIATADTAAVNRANEVNANAILDISKQAYNNLWQYYADTMEWAWTSAEGELDRLSAMAIAELDAKTQSAASAAASKTAAGNAIGSLIGTLGSAYLFGGCWVAREVYGKQNVQWFIFRTWLQYDSPKWFKKLYMKHGETYAKLISKVPPLKWATKKFMDMVINNKRRKHNVQIV